MNMVLWILQGGLVLLLLLSGGAYKVATRGGLAKQYDALSAGVWGVLGALDERSVPGVRKAVRWNSPFYGVEGQGWFLSYHCFTRYVKVTFLRGAALDPQPPEPSKDPNARYLHVHEEDELDEALLGRWLDQAAAMPGDPLFWRVLGAPVLRLGGDERGRRNCLGSSAAATTHVEERIGLITA